jgi:hypothetical protein
MVQCSASDTHGNSSSGSFAVIVRDTTAPVVTSVTATPGVLWPPNHKMVDVQISVVASDLSGDPAPTSRITAVSSSQPASPGEVDFIITGPLTLQLRSERTGGSDRKYTITIVTTDSNNNSTTSVDEVWVSHTKQRASH